MVQLGDRLFLVGKNGGIQAVVASSDESGGIATVSLPTGAKVQSSVWDLFRTQTAANIASVNRMPGAVRNNSPKIVR